MTDLQMGCMGSVILFSENDTYCQQCPLMDDCKAAVDRNRTMLEELTGKPIFEADGKFWASAVKVSRQRKALAVMLSSPETATTPAKPSPIAVEPVIKAPASSLAKLAPFDASLLPGLQKKVCQELVRWSQRGVDPSVIETRHNPFATTQGTESACLIVEVLLAMTSRPTKRELKEAVIAAQHTTGRTVWVDGTASSQVNIVAGAFKACGYDLLKE